ncbi:MAG: hypothetical protein Q8R33_13880 [Burkholderiales bacterium]|nr:hypothetical protein [Burkholderiales bacterium]
MQTLIVAALVGACSVYTLWTLMPSGARRALALALLRSPHLPRRIEVHLQRAAQAASGCGCDGCDRSDKKPAAKTPASQTITFHPRAPR